MPKLVFIRPSDTDPGISRQLLGRCDADLNEEGRRQAEVLANDLAGWDFSFLAASPLKRAIATAMPLGFSQDVSIHPVAGFQAIDMGEWEKKSPEEIRQNDAARFERWLTDPGFPAPGGESIRQVYARAYPELANIVNHARDGETIGLTMQEAVCRAMCCAALDLPLEAANRFHLDNGAYCVFERMFPGGPYRMTLWNRLATLTAEDREFLAFEDEELSGV